jgi:hypothetical protein
LDDFRHIREQSSRLLTVTDSAHLPSVATQDWDISNPSRHRSVVRIAHWIHATSFMGLVVDGIGILLAHPRFYWGETGRVGTPSLLDLRLLLMLGGPSGRARYLHSESAGVGVLFDGLDLPDAFHPQTFLA